jgi:phospholipid/cholesterol/gamma-HCH transport system ATP-binding protein
MDAPVIQIRNLRKQLDGNSILQGISLSIQPNEIFVIMGPSGTGKSTLLKHLVGLLRPDAGEIYLWDSPIHQLDEDQLNAVRRRIGVVFQSGGLFDSLTVGENVAFPLRRHRRVDEATIREAVAVRLSLVDLVGKENLMPSALSGGMRKRVGIARALALNPEIIFYDEPTGGLDPPTARAVDALIQRLRVYLGMTSVLVTHDLDTAFGIADRIAVLNEGVILTVGTPREIVADPRPEIRRFLTPRIYEHLTAAQSASRPEKVSGTS